ncbi:vWA domain-containing protein [Candidatus Uabimicrobium amorphum]|uniref:VWFA domain-containing protein n=1 Tax=Uabimicrobium amorphum TaxID=2596890 RepID=A0A5S9F7B8_UABAM|nr:VWA domain-containing protein [Candidatus Uabimicrobium amorphum]BBM88023.1 hypothetical protein UABAM_06439 [Candidatus Uabimicrobium amorphum]
MSIKRNIICAFAIFFIAVCCSRNSSMRGGDSLASPLMMSATDAREPGNIVINEMGMSDSVVEEMNTEEYSHIKENEFKDTVKEPLSTFSIDVDTASYSNMRRFITQNKLPPKDSIRIEELINYFSYAYPIPEDGVPFSRSMEVAECPWNNDNWLVKIGLQGYKIETKELPPMNLVFLLDVSGSMSSNQKLPLLKTAMGMLTGELRASDTVSIVVYAGAAGLVLPPTPGNDKSKILGAFNSLNAGGSTNGGEGIQLAYDVAAQNFIPNGINRVVLATDGDFNVGISSEGDLIRLIEDKRKSGIFLSVLGLGMYNLNDSMMEKLADKGNGNYAYIDTLAEAKKALVEELGSTLFAIAKDVKIQVEFNPNYVTSYRLIGYENRLLAAEDFNDDTKDAGEIGAGHSVTALYEVVPQGNLAQGGNVDSLKYQGERPLSAQSFSDEILTLKIRYKAPDSEVSELLSSTLPMPVKSINDTSTSFRFASAVAGYGLLLRDSKFKGNVSMELVKSLAMSARGEDRNGYRKEFIDLVDIARTLLEMRQP